MIKLIIGPKGSGKTKKIIDAANAVDTSANDAVFITDTNRYVYDIKHGIRFVNSSDFDVIKNSDTLLGFLGGLFAGNNDLDSVFIDGIARITKKDISKLRNFFSKVYKIAKAEEAVVTFTISMEEADLPEFLNKYKDKPAKAK
ncbi:MAG: hypothetical protein LBP62_00260 [Clostridiales bacterium]|jgi:thymidine kinase|nr:hypothetical protein [Clostridiales bacterium]